MGAGVEDKVRCVRFQLGACFNSTCECLEGDRARNGEESGELRLMFGVLRRGLTDHIAKLKSGEDAEEWLYSDAEPPGWVFSYRFLCSVFDLDPDKFREMAENADPNKITRLKPADYGG